MYVHKYICCHNIRLAVFSRLSVFPLWPFIKRKRKILHISSFELLFSLFFSIKKEKSEKKLECISVAPLFVPLQCWKRRQ